MFKYILLVMFLVTVGASNEDYIDPVINMLLNGISEQMSSKDGKGEEPVFAGGIWKCGNCTDLGEAQMVHSEVSHIDSDENTQEMADVQITLTLEDLRCVTVAGEHPGAVRKLVGTCGGSTVTLSMSPSHNYTIFVYN